MNTTATEPETTTVGQVCNLINGRAFKSTEWSTDGLPIIRIQNLNDTRKKFNYFNGEFDPKHEVNDGDLLFSWSGTPGTSFGAFFWNRGRAVLNQHIFNVHVDHDRVDKNYFRYALNARLDRIIAQAHGGVGLQHITKGKLEATEILFPPLSEQKRIADILDKADAVLRKRQEAATNVAALRRSIFLDLFGNPESNQRGWQEMNFDDALSGGMRNGISPSRSGQEVGKVLVLSAITGDTFDNSAVKESTFAAPFSEDQLVNDREFLICRGNGNIQLVGAGHFPTTSMSDTVFPDTIIAARIDPQQVVPEYLEELWCTRRVRRQIETGARTTNGTHKVNQSVLSGITIPMPPMKEQQRFAESVRTIRRLHHRLKSPLSDDLFNSLVQRAFRGEL